MDISSNYFELPLKLFSSNKSDSDHFIKDVADQVKEYGKDNLVKTNAPESWADKIISLDVDLTRGDYEESLYFSIAYTMMELNERGFKEGTRLVFVPETKYMSFHFNVYVLGEDQ